MPTLTLARKDLRLLLRDRRSAVVLVAMPVVFILVLGLALGEGFGQKPDDRLRVYLVTAEDREFADPNEPYPGKPWSEVVRRDLEQTAGIRVETIPSRAEAERRVGRGEVAAALVFGPRFSRLVHDCSFLNQGLNPFYRDGIDLAALDVTLLRDPTQETAASIIEQVAQVTLLRVVMPWMIGRAFDRVGNPEFMKDVAAAARLPFLPPGMGGAVKGAIERMFTKYNLRAKTWDALTKSEPVESVGASPAAREAADDAGSGLLRRGAHRYQILVPSNTVMFAFFLVLTVGWLFVAERRQGTMLRLRAAPLTRGQILLGKLLPCLLVSLAQGAFLLLAGKAVFGMSWGSEPLWLVPVVACTSLAATGFAVLVASAARTEAQVALFGTLLVLVMAGVSGCLMPRELMPEEMKRVSLVTPHAWALDAYNQLLLNPAPQLGVVALACAVLAGFGAATTALAWVLFRAER